MNSETTYLRSYTLKKEQIPPVISEDIDDYSSELILRGKDFATLITNHNVSSKDIHGEKDIEEEHKESNKDIRLTLDKHNIRPEELPAEEDIKKYNQIKKLDKRE